jgi:hypothetical protein
LLKQPLPEGIEIVAAGENKNSRSSEGGTRKRVLLAPGVKLHLESSSRRKLSEEEIEGLLENVRRHL